MAKCGVWHSVREQQDFAFASHARCSQIFATLNTLSVSGGPQGWGCAEPNRINHEAQVCTFLKLCITNGFVISFRNFFSRKRQDHPFEHVRLIKRNEMSIWMIWSCDWAVFVCVRYAHTVEERRRRWGLVDGEVLCGHTWYGIGFLQLRCVWTRVSLKSHFGAECKRHILYTDSKRTVKVHWS